MPENMVKLVIQDVQARGKFEDEPPPTKGGEFPFDDVAVLVLRRAGRQSSGGPFMRRAARLFTCGRYGCGVGAFCWRTPLGGDVPASLV